MKDRKYIKIPNKITDKSFEMIQDEIDEKHPGYQFKSDIEAAIIKRAIHTTADFDYLNTLSFKQDAIKKVKHVLTHKGAIYTDTTMALSGINKRKLDELGVKYHCLIAEPETFKMAKEKSITRSMAAIELAAQDETEKMFVVGNAPTALYKIIDMQQAGKLDAAVVIGVPVGFVEAKESKVALDESEIPSIVNIDRKGGSNLAAALVNAISYNLDLIEGD
ncbi:cobalt-precorrin-8 methylmutase [Companilactobacillus versmoldensis]|uniref:Cobalt-precorrin-8X methylmutase n=1 Tax=Companilactobacillus versmoldensis DSM 14857 = KCTC 3814 TaxID=1423815 RepID=A0A0R1SGM3_9LACO|nr:cobalt-precorrin-8 methylmutase [Companilactobacillus versmoldensis]KRL68236.1 cobalt-precorrin-8X methylmutase [Companilactobacillus versmoldensis DSM 14857 = KCTC 3814]